MSPTTTDAAETIRNTDRPPARSPRPTWATVIAMMLSVTMPVCGWMVTLSSRVSALEVKTESLATSAQMAEVKQKIQDWIEESDRGRADERARAARGERK